jgi:hypothetical protein
LGSIVDAIHERLHALAQAAVAQAAEVSDAAKRAQDLVQYLVEDLEQAQAQHLDLGDDA